MNFRNKVLFGSLAASIVLIASCRKNEPTPENLIVGVLIATSGARGAYGFAALRGIELATDELNQSGGIQGRKVELKIRDSLGTPEGAKQVAQELISQDRVLAIIGDTSSTRSNAVAPLAQNLKVPLISPSATHPDLTRAGDFIFRACFEDTFQGFVMAKFAFQSLGLKRISMIIDSESTYSQGISELFKKELLQMGGQIISEHSYQSSNREFSASVREILEKKPQAIFIPGTQDEVRQLARELRSSGIKNPLLGSDSWDHPDLVSDSTNFLEPAYFSSHVVSDNFKSYFRDKTGQYPNTYSALSYDAARILFDAMKRAPQITREGIRDQLNRTFLFEGVTGQITFDRDRETKKPAMVWQIKGKQFIPATKIYPPNLEGGSYRR